MQSQNRSCWNRKRRNLAIRSQSTTAATTTTKADKFANNYQWCQEPTTSSKQQGQQQQQQLQEEQQQTQTSATKNTTTSTATTNAGFDKQILPQHALTEVISRWVAETPRHFTLGSAGCGCSCGWRWRWCGLLSDHRVTTVFSKKYSKALVFGSRSNSGNVPAERMANGCTWQFRAARAMKWSVQRPCESFRGNFRNSSVFHLHFGPPWLLECKRRVAWTVWIQVC